MKVVIELNSVEQDIYKKELLENLAQRTIERSQKIAHCDKDTVIKISVAFVSSTEIQRVNREFRHTDAVTDVISVGDYSDDKDIVKEDKKDIFLGELILCYNYIVQSAKNNNDVVDHEFFTVYAHGILHLLGFGHGEEMYQLQESIADQFCE